MLPDQPRQPDLTGQLDQPDQTRRADQVRLIDSG
jgi:hypothetical protein